MHVLDTTCCKSRQLSPFVWGEGFDRFDQTNRPYGDQIFQIFPCVIEFFEDMDTKQRKFTNKTARLLLNGAALI